MANIESIFCNIIGSAGYAHQARAALHQAAGGREVFLPVLIYADKSPELAKVRLNWGTPETPELVPADLIHAAQLQLIRPEEFRKNAVKFGWELWEPKTAQ